MSEDDHSSDSLRDASAHGSHDMDTTEHSSSQPSNDNRDNRGGGEHVPHLIVSPVDSLAALDDVSDITESLPDDIEPSTYVLASYCSHLT